MRIGIDVMGGDYAPLEAVKGAIRSREELTDDTELILIGKEDEIKALLKEHNDASDSFEIVQASEVIDMGEDPMTAVQQKKDSSVVHGFRLLTESKIDAFASAGNTGAMLVGGIYSVGNVRGVIRPTISSIIPKENDKYGIILDVGAISDCKPDILYQFGILGSLYAQHVLKIENPKVGLLNIGEEPGKGNLLTQATYPLMQNNDGKFNFVGNVEGRDLFNEKADVIVCDGFTGNISLKVSEAIYNLLKTRSVKDDYFDRFNYENYGGTPILGLQANVIIGHGISNEKAFKNMILLSRDLVESNLIDKFKDIFN